MGGPKGLAQLCGLGSLGADGPGDLEDAGVLAAAEGYRRGGDGLDRITGDGVADAPDAGVDKGPGASALTGAGIDDGAEFQFDGFGRRPGGAKAPFVRFGVEDVVGDRPCVEVVDAPGKSGNAGGRRLGGGGEAEAAAGGAGASAAGGVAALAAPGVSSVRSTTSALTPSSRTPP
ncbi:MAG: hypothetical protein ACF8R7_09270 [Phycisphaerales bacterium JB039]